MMALMEWVRCGVFWLCTAFSCPLIMPLSGFVPRLSSSTMPLSGRIPRLSSLTMPCTPEPKYKSHFPILTVDFPVYSTSSSLGLKPKKPELTDQNQNPHITNQLNQLVSQNPQKPNGQKKMAYSIRASVCGHHIRTSSSLPWSGSTMDFDVRYCPSCVRASETSIAHTAAQSEYDLYSSFPSSDPDRASARARYDELRAARANETSYGVERDWQDRRARGSVSGDPYERFRNRNLGWTDEERTLFVDPRQTRITDSQAHTRESDYRRQPEYRRHSRSYSRGMHAAPEGSSYENTSNPYDPDSRYQNPRRTSSTRSTSSSSRTGGQAYTSSRTRRGTAYPSDIYGGDDEDEAEYERRIREALGRYVDYGS